MLRVRQRDHLEPHSVPGNIQAATARRPANHVFGRSDSMSRRVQTGRRERRSPAERGRDGDREVGAGRENGLPVQLPDAERDRDGVQSDRGDGGRAQLDRSGQRQGTQRSAPHIQRFQRRVRHQNRAQAGWNEGVRIL